MHTGMSIVRQIDHEFLTVSLRADGVVHVWLKPNTEINVDLQFQMIQIYMDITGGKKSLFIFEAGEFVSITKEAREFAIKMEKDTPTFASAIVVRNLGQKIIADFYYKVNKPLQPYKVFWKIEKAEEWLSNIKIE
jgi:hypothetical protein